MSRAGRILIVDDEERWRKVLSQTLENDGFYVEVAATLDQALECLDKTLYHLLVLDIRMKHADPSNVQGMHLLHILKDRGLSTALKVIMLTAYGSLDQMREAFRDYEVADFIAKGDGDFDNLEFLKQVRRIFAEEIQNNLKLAIHWQNIESPEQAVLNLEVNGNRVKPNHKDGQAHLTADRVATELDDLLCRLFHKAKSVLVKPLTPGHSGAGVLWAKPFYENGGGEAVVVKFGDARQIDKESSNFKAYAQPFLGGGRSTTIIELRRTPLLGGILYSLLGTASDKVEDFGSYYRRAAVPEIKEVLERLIRGTCGAWYANPGHLQPHDLSADYQQLLGLTQEKLEEAMGHLTKSVQGRQMLHFTALSRDRAFLNPVLATANQHLMEPTYVCTTHGDFSQHNLLVDETGQVWLIDFFRTGPGHILRDVVQLETVVRLQLLAPDEATLEERLRMEEKLCSIERFSELEQLADDFQTTNPALAKAYAIAVHLRTLAGKLMAHDPDDSIKEYYIAALYYALNLIRFLWLPAEQRAHALLSASLLVERLGLK